MNQAKKQEVKILQHPHLLVEVSSSFATLVQLITGHRVQSHVVKEEII